MAHLRLPPELLLLVMKQVNHGEEYHAARKSLLNAMLVNHEWAEAATHILWEKGAFVSALAQVSADRRQHYASKISELYFDNEEEGEHHATFKDLNFPRLKIVYCARVKLKKRKKLYLTQYMQPQLREFHWWGGGLCENALPTLALTCPRLEVIRFEEPVDRSSQNQVLDFFANCKSLEVVGLGDGWTDRITPEWFAGLAGHEGLEKLDITPMVATLTIQTGLSMASNPFRNLQNLHMTVESDSIRHLASVITSLSVLFLIIVDSDNDALASLGSMTNMVHLELTFLDDTQLSPQGFRALEKLKLLEVLLMASRGAILEAMWMDDSIFTAFTSSLPHLKCLEFRLDCDVTTSALTSLGRTHPNISSFDFFGDFDFSEWTRLATPLFPNLVRFVVESPSIEGRTRSAAYATLEERARQIAGLLLRHCPMLDQLSFHSYYENDLAELVIKSYGDRVKGRFSEPMLTWFRSFEESSLIKFHPSETRIFHDWV
ncbi:hypothetical protein E4T48_06616 [Aureobasidium sp. EXF-10727]|nr:hypothetical protein E4T48_06616 [Aureobasidium sp. EXF-10727]